jgi:hypothetical protein
MTRSLRPLTLALALLVGCSADGSTTATPAPSGPSGALGVVTAQAAAETVSALCGMRRDTDRDTANAVFYDRAHGTLHALAAAAEDIDRAAAGQVLVTMQRVEADLQADELPATFGEDAGALLLSVRSALATVDLPAPDC